MVFTRSMIIVNNNNNNNNNKNDELERIRIEYDSSDEFIEVVADQIQRTKHKEIIVQIDFDDAHNEWIANKRRKSDGNYVYICGAPLKKKGHICRRDSIDKIGLYSGCKQHPSWEEAENKLI
jgi:hypothetical protein